MIRRGARGSLHRRTSDEARPPSGLTARRLYGLSLVVLGAMATVAALWLVRDILLLVFGAVLVSVLLRSGAMLLERWTPLGPKVALALVLGVLIAVIAGVVVLFGAQIAGEARSLGTRIPDALDALRTRLGIETSVDTMLDQVREMLQQRSDTLLGRAGAILYGTVGAVVNLVLVITGGVYFAVQPELYRAGLVRLLAPLGRARTNHVLDAIGRNLRQWLVGQLLSMAFVAVATTVALWLIGVPNALALGLVAGLAEFVPVIGPIAAAVPAVLLASSEGLAPALWTVGAFVVIQQVESNVALPLIQREMVALPPALTVFSILAFGVLLGPLGVLFGAPLTVVAFVLVRELTADPPRD